LLNGVTRSSIFHKGVANRPGSIMGLHVDLLKREEQAEIDFEKRLIGHPMEDKNTFVGFLKFRELEEKYLPEKKCGKGTKSLRSIEVRWKARRQNK